MWLEALGNLEHIDFILCSCIEFAYSYKKKKVQGNCHCMVILRIFPSSSPKEPHLYLVYPDYSCICNIQIRLPQAPGTLFLHPTSLCSVV